MSEITGMFPCNQCNRDREHFYSFKIVKWVCQICLNTSELKGNNPYGPSLKQSKDDWDSNICMGSVSVVYTMDNV